MKGIQTESKPKIKRHIIKELKAEIKEHKASFVVYVILRALVILAMVLSVVTGQYENLFVCTFSLVLFLAPAFFEKNFGINLPSVLEIIILLFIFASQILGELGSYYLKFPLWDTILHTVNGFISAAVGFSMVDLLNRNDRVKLSLSPAYLAIVAFCFSMTIGVLWEFFEFSCDLFMKTDMQKDTVINVISTVNLNTALENEPVIISNITDTAVNGSPLGVTGYLDIGLIDTMKDLFVNFIGALVFSIFGYFYVKSRGKGKFIKMFIPTLEKDSK